MKKILLFTISFAALIGAVALLYHVAGSGSQPDASISEQFTAAKASADEGEIKEAIAGYQSLLDGGHRSASIYYNIAIAQHREGDLGTAILNYERAAYLEPGSTDIAANLSRARKDAAAIEPEPEGWRKFTALLSSNGWSSLGATALFVLAAAAGIAALGKVRLPRTLVGIGTAFAFLTICTSTTVLTTRHRDNSGSAIVLKPGTSLRVSPFDGAKAVATLPAGKTVRLSDEKSHEDYRLVSLPSGQSGWLLETEAEAIITDP